MGQGDKINDRFIMLQRSFAINELSQCINNQSSFLLSLLESGYEAGYRDALGESLLIVEYKNTITNQIYRRNDDGLFNLVVSGVEQSTQVIDPLFADQQYTSNQLNGDEFIPTKIIVKNKLYEIHSSN